MVFFYVKLTCILNGVKCKNFESVVFIVRQTRVFSYFPFALKCSSLFSLPFTADKQHCAWPRLHASSAIVLMAKKECTVL